jgi:cytochrome b pre-mRNA-processing protein 3
MHLSSRARRRRIAAEQIYAASVAAARRPALYMDLGVPDTPDGRFEMLVLHLFPVLNRLVHDPGDDPDLARVIAESFVAHLDDSFRESGVGDMSVPRRMRTAYGVFARRLSAYREAFHAGEEALASAIAHSVFSGTPATADPARLAAYLSAASLQLRSAVYVELLRGEVSFPALPST